MQLPLICEQRIAWTVIAGAAILLPAALVRAAEEPAPRRPTLDQALAQEVRLEFVKTPVADVADYLSDLAGVPVVLDKRPLVEANLESAPITYSAGKQRLASALERMLDPLGLAWIAEGEVLMITTAEAAATRVTTRTFYVADLAWWGGSAELVALVRKSVDPGSWSEFGGEGTIRAFESKLVVSQTHANQQRVWKLLYDLRLRR